MSTRVTRARMSGGDGSVRPEILAAVRPLNASRSALLFGTALGLSLAVVAAAAPNTAAAADECGVNAAGAAVLTCPTGVLSGGIEYVGGDDLTIVLPDNASVLGGVSLEGTGAQSLQAGLGTSIVNVAGTGASVVSLDGAAGATVNDVTATGGVGLAVSGASASATVQGDVASAADDGVVVEASVGDAVLTNTGSITAGAGADAAVVLADTGAALATNLGVMTSTAGDGLIAISQSGSVDVDNSGTITAVDGVGVTARTDLEGPVTVTNSGTVTAGEEGVFAYSFDEGDVTVGNSGTITSGSTGVSANAWFSGDTRVTNTGVINAVDTGIYAYAYEDDVAVVNDETVVVANTDAEDSAIGIQAYAAGAGATELDGSDITVTHNGTIEVDAAGAATGVSVEADDGHALVQGAGDIDVFTTGQTAVGVDLIGGDADRGATVALTGDITVEQTAVYGGPLAGTPGHMWYDYQAVGVQAVNVQGPLSISVGDVNATGYVAQGVVVQGADPTSPIAVAFDDITVTSGGGGGHGVFVYAAADGDVTVSGDTITTTGDYSDGVNIGGAGGIVGDVEVQVNGITTDGFNADGVHVDAQGPAAGNVSVTTGSIVVAGEDSAGVEIAAVGGGDIEVTSGAISVADGLGMDLSGDGDVTVTSTGLLTASDGGIRAATTGDGALSVTNTGSISATGAGAAGLELASVDGDIIVTSVNVSAADGTAMVLSSDSGDIDVTTSGTLSSNSVGIEAESATGDVSATVDGDLVIAGDGDVVGLDLQADNGHVTVDGDGSIDVSTTGASAVGLAVNGDIGTDIDTGLTVDLTGPITVEQTGVFDPEGPLSPDSYLAVGVQALDLDGAVDLGLGDVTVTGRTAYGVQVQTNVPTQPVTVDFADIDVTAGAGGGAGVMIDAAPGATVTVSGDSIVTAGADTAGVSIGDAGDVAGDVSVDVGSITTTGDFADGVVVGADGAISVTTDQIETSGDGAFGVRAFGSGPAVDLAVSGDVTTHGLGAYGVAAAADGDVSIVSDGEVFTDGDGAHGVYGFSTGGDVSVTGAAEVLGLGANGLHAEAPAGSASVTVNGATSSQDGYGVFASAADTTSVNVLTGATVSGDEAGVYAVSGLGTTLTNNGTISGADGIAIDVDGASAALTNAASGTIIGGVDLTDFDDTVVNAGAFVANVDSDFGLGVDRFTNTGTVGVDGDIAFAGLEAFDNRGLVDMVDGATNDVLDLTGATFNGQAGSTLALDVNLGTGASDRLVVGDLTGVTELELTNVGGLPGTLGQTFNLVDSASNETGGEVVMDDNLDVGFVEYGLTFDAASDSWGLVGLASTEVYQPVKAGQAAQDYWRRSADAWSAQMQTDRDGGPADGVQSWVQVYGGGQEFDSVRTFDPATGPQDLSMESSWRGVQAGVDTGAGGARFGVTAGYLKQEDDFRDGPNGFETTGWNIGAYGAWSSGGLFLNGLAKADLYDMDVDFGTAGLNTTLEGHTYGLQGEVGYRFGDTTFVEPVAGLSWSKTDLDGYSGQGVAFNYDDVTSLEGRVGARVGTRWDVGGAVATPFVGIYAVNEFDGENSMRFATGPTGLTVVDEPRGSYGKVDFGISTLTVGGLEAFAKGEADFGDTSGFAARIGARWRW